MKTFFLIVALCASVAVATPDVNLNKKIAACIKTAQYTEERYRDECSKPQPEDKSELETLDELIACIYKATKVVYRKPLNRKKIVVSSKKAAKLVPSGEAQKVIQAVKGCKRYVREKGESDVNISAIRLNYCLHDKYPELAVQTCLSTIDGVEVYDENVSIDEVQLEDMKASIEYLSLDDEKA